MAGKGGDAGEGRIFYYRSKPEGTSDGPGRLDALPQRDGLVSTAFLNEFVTWEHIDSRSATVKIEDHGIEAMATMHFDDAGRFLDFVADRRRVKREKDL